MFEENWSNWRKCWFSPGSLVSSIWSGTGPVPSSMQHLLRRPDKARTEWTLPTLSLQRQRRISMRKDLESEIMWGVAKVRMFQTPEIACRENWKIID